MAGSLPRGGVIGVQPPARTLGFFDRKLMNLVAWVGLAIAKDLCSISFWVSFSLSHTTPHLSWSQMSHSEKSQSPGQVRPGSRQATLTFGGRGAQSPSPASSRGRGSPSPSAHNKSGKESLSCFDADESAMKQAFDTWKKSSPKTIVVDGSPCMVGGSRDGRMSSSGNKVAFGYHYVALTEFGRARLSMVSSAKTEAEPQTISHLCGTRNCLTSSHLVLERKLTNDERTHCHFVIKNFVERKNVPPKDQYRAVQEFMKMDFCPHDPKCCHPRPALVDLGDRPPQSAPAAPKRDGDDDDGEDMSSGPPTAAGQL